MAKETQFLWNMVNDLERSINFLMSFYDKWVDDEISDKQFMRDFPGLTERIRDVVTAIMKEAEEKEK